VQAFAKHGIHLQRGANPWGPAAEWLETRGDRAPTVTAVVFRPGLRPPREFGPKSLHVGREMDSRQRWTRHGNVLVEWLQLGRTERTTAAIHAALRSLRYSPTEAAPLLLPPIELHPGESRTVHAASYPSGTTVACVSGSRRVEEFLIGGSWVLNSNGNKTKEITLRRSARSGSRRTYSCVSGSPSAPLPVIKSPKSCTPGPRTVRFAGLVARIPRGWYAATERKHGFLWIGNQRRCAVNWPISTYGIYVQLWITPGIGPIQPRKAVRHFTRLREVMDHGHVPGAYLAALWSTHHSYTLNIQMGAAAPKHHGLKRAKFIRRRVTLPPSLMSFPG
jgi:hypothetical protein